MTIHITTKKIKSDLLDAVLAFMDKLDYTNINSKTIDGWIENGWIYGTPITHEEYAKAKNGDKTIRATPSYIAQTLHSGLFFTIVNAD